MNVAWGGDLLRTRVNLTLQEQNKDLLATMNHRSNLQFRLQETVEGLSVAATNYYLISYVLSGLPLETWKLEKNCARLLGTAGTRDGLVGGKTHQEASDKKTSL